MSYSIRNYNRKKLKITGCLLYVLFLILLIKYVTVIVLSHYESIVSVLRNWKNFLPTFAYLTFSSSGVKLSVHVTG